MEDYEKERRRILGDFGLKLAKLRVPLGSQEAFAKAGGVNLHRNWIGSMERGESEPGLLTLLILAAAFEDDSFWELLKSLPVPEHRQAGRAGLKPAQPLGASDVAHANIKHHATHDTRSRRLDPRSASPASDP